MIKTVIKSKTSLDSRLQAAVFMIIDLRKKLDKTEERIDLLERCLESAENRMDKYSRKCFCGMWDYHGNMKFCGECENHCCIDCIIELDVEINQNCVDCAFEYDTVICKDCFDEDDIYCSCHVKQIFR